MFLHDLGYTYNGDAPITGLTQFELDKLQLGWLVRQEKQEDRVNAARSGHSTYTEQRKRSHEERLARRSRQLQQN